MAADTAAATEDAVLGGRLRLRQPRKGHRVGHDAILLAAACAVRAGEHAVDLGAGVGAAGLALARRVAGVTVTLVEIDPMLAQFATENAALNGLADRVRAVCLDATAPAAAFAAAGLASGTVGHVLMNPPFNAPHNPSPDRRRRLAHHAPHDDTLTAWLRTAARLLRPTGAVTLIWRADGLDSVLGALAGFGGTAVLPIHGRPEAPAIRVLVRAAKTSRAPLVLLPGLCLADEAGAPSAPAEAVLRDGAALPLATA